MNPDRIVVGVESERGTKIGFINQIAALCERVGADLKSVAKSMGLDARIGKKVLHAGPGYGGLCFTKDTSALTRIEQENAIPQTILEKVIQVNDAAKLRMIEKLRYLCEDSFYEKTVAVVGVTFKPNNDDMHDAPNLTIIPALVRGGARVRVVDPQGRREGKAPLPNVSWHKNPYEATQDTDLLVILTEWNEFRALDLSRLARTMAQPRMADLRNIYSTEALRAAGFEAYVGVGR